ncbi:WecB/TagA/CpsF family glycosyltransferase [Oscillospiraceae bacterium HV4-5-C5C]|nr:WecB/TagA/CpsF family glycosyltransferase [Oscillospiraceae bacterium HV4-5-C5C]
MQAQRFRFMNTEIDNLTMQEALGEIDRLIQEKNNAYVVTPNVDHIVQLETNEELRKIYADASLILADGKPLLWLAKWYGTPIKEKISGSDLFPLLCKMAAEKGYKMFFLGAAEGVAAKAADNLAKRFSGLQVVGTYSPPLGFEKDRAEIERIKSMIKETHPDILIIGLGCPKQEKYIYYNREELGVPISLGLGASFDFEAGIIKRAPRWMANHGLEWLYRITQDPKRMAKRYLVDDRKILGLAIKYRKRIKNELNNNDITNY